MGSGGLAMAIGEFGGDLGDAGCERGPSGAAHFRVPARDPPVNQCFRKILNGEVPAKLGLRVEERSPKMERPFIASFLNTENHFSYRQNYLDLDPMYKDKWGDPLLRVTMNWTDSERKQAAFMLENRCGSPSPWGFALNPPNGRPAALPLMVDQP